MVSIRMKSTLEALGLRNVAVDCLLVGVKIPGHENAHDVCVEPEDGKWDASLFAHIPSTLASRADAHPGWGINYTDAQTRREQPDRILADTVRQEVQDALCTYDTENGVQSFCGMAYPVSDHYVVPILQLENSLLERFPSLQEDKSESSYTPPRSMIHAAVDGTLGEAYKELESKDPGRYFISRAASSHEIISNAAQSFLYAPGKAIGDEMFMMANLFERLNVISSWMYEGSQSKGRMLLAMPSCDEIHVRLQFRKKVPFDEPRWARKVLQMASSGMPLVADTQGIYGLGELSEEAAPWDSQEVFEIVFDGHYRWHLSCGDHVLLVSKYGIASLPQPAFAICQLTDTHSRLFPNSKPASKGRLVSVCDAALRQGHGSMLVVAEDAKSEAERLEGQGSRIKPVRMTQRLYRQVSRIDGCILVDPDLVCHAVGVILDGPAHAKCTPARGARYNSGLRYVRVTGTRRMALVISDDGTADLIPEFRPLVSRSEVEERVVQLERATSDNYGGPINWLNSHRFYLREDQCQRANKALTRIEQEPLEIGRVRWEYRQFVPDEDLDDSYFQP